MPKGIRAGGQDPAERESLVTDGTLLTLKGGQYLCLSDIDRMPPFLMSVVSDSDFWLFVGSNGGFTAGRVDPDHAIFPYQTADKILNQPGSGGVSTLFVCDGGFWEPWRPDGSAPGIVRNLYKHVAGTSVVFEEIHRGLGLAFRWELAASERFGLVRTCRLENLGEVSRSFRMLDGWKTLLPSGVTQETYARYSYLAAAYMRHEAVPGCGLGIYTLNSGITDRAEPCESLRATCAWSLGLEGATLLISDQQVDAFRRGSEVHAESEARGVFGAHLLSAHITLAPGESREWVVVVDTGLDHTRVSRLQARLLEPESLRGEITRDLEAGVLALRRRIAGAGAIQQTADPRVGIHHFANVLFNCMRGGTLHDHYRFPRGDFAAFLKSRSATVLARHRDWVSALPDPCTLAELAGLASRRGDPQLSRLAGEYLPLCFSRRHGDPSRPWNRFEIHTRDSEGRPLFAYAGNWRDIFQNWESLAYNYPLCFGPMIAIFLNASTADGYNPYRITREGIDWEVFDANDPWSHIGYWGDHQIIYLLRLLEGQERFYPGRLTARLGLRCHASANVPYEILGFDDLLRAPKHSIRFNDALHRELTERARSLGGDAKLLADADGEVALASLAEKLLLPLLVKLSNLVPGGGIWLNTQRPEWNDANNALAGWGLSVVTVGYLRRYLVFLGALFGDRADDGFEISRPVADLLAALAEILPRATAVELDDEIRMELAEALGRAGERHRTAVYTRQPADLARVRLAEIRAFLAVALAAVDATLAANRRHDHLFHSYNLLEVRDRRASVHRLDLMLEGQVSALSSGALKPGEALGLMEALRNSALYREDQNSYLLYPDRKIVPFLDRNRLPADWKARVPRLAALVDAGDRDLIRIDDRQGARFHPDFASARDLNARLDQRADEPGWREAVAGEREGLLGLWEEVFHHRFFTGRSGAMFGFEGLGSIYWHMVAKLLLAVQEVHATAHLENPSSGETARLAGFYRQVRAGLGFTKDARTYGAFPTDPYSHSPRGRGAQQPGMTGQVKEEILTRAGELGVQVDQGRLGFTPVLLDRSEFFTSPHAFAFIDLGGQERTWQLGPNSLAFTAFQVPVCYVLGACASITLEHSDGGSTVVDGSLLPEAASRRLFEQDGFFRSITVTIPQARP
jgi:hypothetical protein